MNDVVTNSTSVQSIKNALHFSLTQIQQYTFYSKFCEQGEQTVTCFNSNSNSNICFSSHSFDSTQRKEPNQFWYNAKQKIGHINVIVCLGPDFNLVIGKKASIKCYWNTLCLWSPVRLQKVLLSGIWIRMKFAYN